ncbi:M15 family metallopeptidase [Ethanoligenens harbinense]|uniref:Serine-type D-Ala-D-Ala carboxypeptidase n=1 Tax=Ethanoligenens harbinense (strain DSM 18485 / JCM 12961 / CGMCC 1.5033 / YUAN-3) TaxID=663278 RepID=E6U7W0_ETHHY|nr:M15 family metallopeptidase [Ethanoligenens harbinense]ADU25892.1 Serine-type D-Ala-D-Ala carboxypeptidase [Ethanoligenens harbinense YUAN-3]
MAKRTLRPGCCGFLAAIAVCVVGGLVFAYAIFNKHNATTSSGTSTGVSSQSVSASVSKALAPASEMKTGGLLMLINAKNPLPSDYTPTLALVDKSYYTSSDKDNHFDSRAAPHLSQMIHDARADGVQLVIYSGYRSMAYQTDNFDRKVSEYRAQGYGPSTASSKAATLVAPPGTSEHESGLAADIVSSDWLRKNGDLNETFEKTTAFAWLEQHAADYGFILRYPKDKTDITGISYEPWHWRYVGKDNAEKINSAGLCLEEYDGKA